MLPWTKLAATNLPDGAELSLWRRGDEVVVRIRNEELMSNRQHGSEERLAEIACENLEPGARVLVGGLGLGFTLKAALASLPAKSEVVVGELVPALVDWLREHLGAGALLDDRRVHLELGNVVELLRKSRARFDAIMLDVDNGPSALSTKENQALYGARGLAAAKNALKPGGRLAIWSAGPDEAFLKRFERAGFDARVVNIRARRDKGPRHVLFIGDALA
jgi:spermidine synthase